MTKEEVLEALKDKTPVYYVDEYEPIDCPVMESDVCKARLFAYHPNNTMAALVHKETDEPFMIDIDELYLDQTEADEESVRRFKRYVKNLEKEYKNIEETLSQCHQRLKELETPKNP